jgi:hypothetical protein
LHVLVQIGKEHVTHYGEVLPTIGRECGEVLGGGCGETLHGKKSIVLPHAVVDVAAGRVISADFSSPTHARPHDRFLSDPPNPLVNFGDATFAVGGEHLLRSTDLLANTERSSDTRLGTDSAARKEPAFAGSFRHAS